MIDLYKDILEIFKKDSDILFKYKLCNQKRSLYLEKHNRKHYCGLCMVSCPFGI